MRLSEEVGFEGGEAFGEVGRERVAAEGAEGRRVWTIVCGGERTSARVPRRKRAKLALVEQENIRCRIPR